MEKVEWISQFSKLSLPHWRFKLAMEDLLSHSLLLSFLFLYSLYTVSIHNTFLLIILMVCYVTVYILVFGTGAEELQRLRDEATSDAEEKNEDPPSFNCGSLYFKFIIKAKVSIFPVQTHL